MKKTLRILQWSNIIWGSLEILLALALARPIEFIIGCIFVAFGVFAVPTMIKVLQQYERTRDVSKDVQRSGPDL